MQITKNREREDYSFANINLLGKCNVDCYFCLGKDISDLLNKHNQLTTHFTEWKNFDDFVNLCDEKGIQNLYITGQNTDSLLYKHLEDLISWLQYNRKFKVGIRTNGYLAPQKMDIINMCDASVGYSIHTFNGLTNKTIMGRIDIPNWDNILKQTNQCRVSIVVNRYNVGDFWGILDYLSKFDNVKYIQARRISTDTRYEELKEDINVYEQLYRYISQRFPLKKEFYGAQIYEIHGKEVCFWRTVETSVNSMNYFTDGTISEEYFVVEGYLKNYKEQHGRENKSIC